MLVELHMVHISIGVVINFNCFARILYEVAYLEKSYYNTCMPIQYMLIR